MLTLYEDRVLAECELLLTANNPEELNNAVMLLENTWIEMGLYSHQQVKDWRLTHTNNPSSEEDWYCPAYYFNAYRIESMTKGVTHAVEWLHANNKAFLHNLKVMMEVDYSHETPVF